MPVSSALGVPNMHAVRVTIERFVDESFPGFVECRLVDANGKSHLFVEKVPVVSKEHLTPESEYPRNGVIACELMPSSGDRLGKGLVLINTEKPLGIFSIEGQASFPVLEAELVTL